ncbi:MAG TPA: glycosyltransferase family 2 protein [Candidatus Omnitrophota bacterium]|nr:glycosyltransferase family 2 protein [Candidatus Omnitrophota bacterium]
MQLPVVDVVIPHLNDRERLAECLSHLERQTYPADCFRVLVVDNGSQQPIDDVTARFPMASCATEAEKGCGPARNKGVSLTNGDILAFTDSDCRPEPDWLLNAVNRLTHQPIDIVAGDIKVFAADEERPTDVELFDKVFGFEARRYAERKHFATGANIVVPRRVFEQVGPFRNGSLPEDLEWGRRAHAIGFRIGFAPDVVVRHPARRTWAELKRKTERTSWHARNYMGEQRFFRLRWAAYTLGMASPPLWKVVQILTSSELNGTGQRMRTIATLLRIRSYRVAIMAGYLFEPVPVRAESEAS